MSETRRADIVVDLCAHLAAAVSLLEGSPKTAAGSDKMFDMMLADYRASLERGRAFVKGDEAAGDRRAAAVKRRIDRLVSWQGDARKHAKPLLGPATAEAQVAAREWWSETLNQPEVVLSDDLQARKETT